MARCEDCRHAVRDWEDYWPCGHIIYNGCKKGGDMEAEDCDMWEVRKDG